MKKVLYVATIEKTISEFFLPFGDYFRAKGWQVDCISNTADGRYDECSRHFDNRYFINWTRNPLNIANFIEPARTIRSLVYKEKYDIVHVHTPVAAFVTRFALRHLHGDGAVKIIYTAHGFHFYKGNNWLKNFLFITAEKLAAKWTDCLVVINDEDYQAAVKHLLPQNKVVLLPGIGIDLSVYNREKISEDEISNVKAKMGLKSDDVLFLMIAEFVPRKRHKDVINAIAMANNPHIHVAFAGDGPLLDKIKSMTLTAGVSTRIHFLGQRHDIPALIAASHMTLLPSQQEGLPKSVMESMAEGVPVIGTDIRGTRDLLSGGCGIILTVGDIKGLASAISNSALHDKNYFAEMVTRAKAKCAALDLSVIEKDYENLYKHLLNLGD